LSGTDKQERRHQPNRSRSRAGQWPYSLPVRNRQPTRDNSCGAENQTIVEAAFRSTAAQQDSGRK
jgi:hypothetical protein